MPPAWSPKPNPETVKRAIPVLQAELSLASSNLDGLDRKAAFLPPVLVALAGLLLPRGAWNTPQVVLVVLALAAGAISVVLVFRVVLPGQVSLGPNADQLTRGLTMPVDQFDLRVAVSLAGSVESTSATSALKGRQFQRATYFAGAAILFLILAQVAGGLAVADQQNTNPASPGAAPSSQGPTAVPAATPAPAATPSPQTPGTTNTGPALPDFGQQLATRSGFPDFGQQLMTKGGPLPATVEQRIITKGG